MTSSSTFKSVVATMNGPTTTNTVHDEKSSSSQQQQQQQQQQHFYEPRNGHGIRHNPFNSIIAPRPIGWIASKSLSGNVNLAPYSFFNCLNYNPPIIGFSSIGYKDTVQNCSETGEFTWNLATMDLAENVNTSCEPFAPDVNEFDLAGLTQLSSRLVSPPRVGESPVHFECKVTQIVQLKNQDNILLDTHMVVGEVIGVHINHDLLDDGVYNTVRANPIFRGGGPADYFGISQDNKFIMHRKYGHLEQPESDPTQVPCHKVKESVKDK